MSERQYWIPFLSDNVYRLTGVGSQTPLPQVRQAVKRVEAGLRVGINPEVPLSTLLGDEEIKNLTIHLQQISSDATRYICHKLLWFLDWSSDGINLQSVEDVVDNARCDSKLFAHQSDFLYNFFCFLENHDSESLEDSIAAFDSWYNDESSDDYFVSLISSELNISDSLARESLYDAQQIVAKTVLETSVNIAIGYLEHGDFLVGKQVLSVIVNSPLEDDWEDAVLMKVSNYAFPIINRIQEITRTYQNWHPSFTDPLAQDCEKLMSLVELLRGRVAQAREWESAVQAWIDKLAVSMSNYAVQQVNEILNRLPAIQFSSNQTKINTLIELHARLQQAQQIIRQALSKKTSTDVKQNLSRILTETQQLIAQLPPIPASSSSPSYQPSGRNAPVLDEELWHRRFSEAARSRNAYQPDPVESCLFFIFYRILFFVIIILLLGLCSSFRSCSSSGSSGDIQESVPYQVADNSHDSMEYIHLVSLANDAFNSRRYSEASQNFAKVIRLSREKGFLMSEDVYYKYGVALENSRNRSTALWAYQTYLTRNPTGEYASEALKKLEKLGIVSRPKTGQSPLGRGVYSGYSEIVIDNQTDRDALVKIVKLGSSRHQVIRNLYVRAGSSARATQIPQGEYTVKVAYGKAWDKKRKKFLLEKSFSKSETFTIEEYRSGFAIHYSETTITLHEVLGGNFSFHAINESQF